MYFYLKIIDNDLLFAEEGGGILGIKKKNQTLQLKLRTAEAGITLTDKERLSAANFLQAGI